jgi:hypothetical protein
MYDFAWKHFKKLSQITIATAPFHHYRQQLDLPNDLKNKIGFSANLGELIYLKNFIDNIDEIRNNLEKDSLFYQQL